MSKSDSLPLCPTENVASGLLETSNSRKLVAACSQVYLVHWRSLEHSNSNFASQLPFQGKISRSSGNTKLCSSSEWMAGPQCCSNPPKLGSSGGVGHEEEVGGLRSYVTGPADSKVAVLLVSDVFGYEAPKLRKLADKVAGFGFFVVVPDFLQGDYVVWGVTPIEDWLKKHGPDQGFEHAKPVIEALKSKGITKVGAGGFCWGAKVVVELAKYPYIDAAVLLHPSLVSLDDIKGVKVPIAILGAEKDQWWPPEVLRTFEEALNAKPEVDGFVKIYPGADHGWTVRYKDEDEREVKLAGEAHQDAVDWFAKYLK